MADKTLRYWARQADADAGVGTPGVMTTPVKEELSALRKSAASSRGNGISRSGYYAWRIRKPSPRKNRNVYLPVAIREIFEAYRHS